MGILYSRSIEALSSKGKYIFSLDNDDMFLDFDVFSTIKNIAEEGNFDIVEFRGAMTTRVNVNNIIETRVTDIYFTQKKTNLVLFQPELGDYMLTPLNNYKTLLNFELLYYLYHQHNHIYKYQNRSLHTFQIHILQMQMYLFPMYLADFYRSYQQKKLSLSLYQVHCCLHFSTILLHYSIAKLGLEWCLRYAWWKAHSVGLVAYQ